MVDLRSSNTKLRDRAARIVCTLTGLSRPEAFDYLARADGHVKVAIVMVKRGVDAAEARRLLEAAGGHLRGAIG
jgi:N-acetylmuramic acid 6-phosphate etherase